MTTSACSGGQPWKPRLQRLADARQLAPFEKLVLELLVGCHVSPSVQRTFLANKPGNSMDEMTSMSPITVNASFPLQCLSCTLPLVAVLHLVPVLHLFVRQQRG